MDCAGGRDVEAMRVGRKLGPEGELKDGLQAEAVWKLGLKVS